LNCPLDYIPKHLHTIDKPTIVKFTVGEELYYRCRKGTCEKPYDQIPLFDISHNRNFGQPSTYLKDDVLYNIIEGDPNERYENLEVITLIITQLKNNTTYTKEIVSSNNPNLKVNIKLIHDPEPCMYPHSVFEISINDEIINRNNFKKLLNKKNRTYKNLRTDIRQELSSMIQSGLINDNIDVEIIDNP